MGDISITPPPGYWIDYARSGRISANRHIVHFIQGAVRDYSSGNGYANVYDNDGRVLYTIEEATRSGMMVNYFLGDEDSYLMLMRGDLTHFTVYHPAFGSRVFDIPVRESADLAYRNFKYFCLMENKHQIYIKYEITIKANDLPKNDGGTENRIEYDFIGFPYKTPADFFADATPDLQFSARVLPDIFFETIGSDGIVLTDIRMVNGFLFIPTGGQAVDFPLPAPPTKAVWFSETAKVRTAAYHQGLFFIDMGDISGGKQVAYLLITNQNGTVLCQMSGAEKYDRAPLEFMYWFTEVSGGHFSKEGTTLTTSWGPKKLAFDMVSKTLEVWNPAPNSPHEDGQRRVFDGELYTNTPELYRVEPFIPRATSPSTSYDLSPLFSPQPTVTLLIQ
jgi:hypothetical protein